MVVQPGRQVDAMVNEVDIFQLFGEIAGIDVKRAVPRPIDSYPLMPYLINPNQSSLRPYNFTEGGLNIQKDGAHNPPCVFAGIEIDGVGVTPSQCSQTPLSQSVCQDNGGTWWGPGVGTAGLTECWQVNQSIWKQDPDPIAYSKNKVSQNPQKAIAVRNQTYKLVHNEWQDYDIKTDGPMPVTSIEFYEVSEDPKQPLIDTEKSDLLPGPLTQEQQLNFDGLQKRMDAVLASAPACPGDGNGDSVVNYKDVFDFFRVTHRWSGSSHYDFNFDGSTDSTDLGMIYDNFGACPKRSHQ